MCDNNQAFVDGQNFYMNTKANNWSVDLKKFRIYLREKYNVDTDIVFTIMSKVVDREEFDKIFLVSGDGDYFRMVKYLVENGRFGKLLSPNRHLTSSLYRTFPPKYIDFLDKPEIKKKIAYKEL